ncbi:hypothetical protein GCM10026988_17380 [Vibrio panuliri]|uniref:Lipoprotein n=1 Tax=Vibrio panuliri TaxID=1381081 RepID=A0ABX3F6N1_9VIBR|nr:hypothetical protein BIY20_15665 [Vibrio panuliri]
MFKYICIAGVLVLMVGCTSSTRNVEAKVPLVETRVEKNGEKVPTLYRQFLESNENESLLTPEQAIYFQDSYLSALGQKCRNVLFESNNGVSVKRVACTENKLFSDQVRAWYFIPNL